MTLEDLEHAAGVFEGRIGLRGTSPQREAVAAVLLTGGGCCPRRSTHRRRLLLDAGVLPCVIVILRAVRIPAGEQAVEIFRVPEILADDRGCVRVPHDVVAELPAVLEDVV